MRDSKGLLRYSLEEPKGISLRIPKEFLRESFWGAQRLLRMSNRPLSISEGL